MSIPPEITIVPERNKCIISNCILEELYQFKKWDSDQFPQMDTPDRRLRYNTQRNFQINRLKKLLEQFHNNQIKQHTYKSRYNTYEDLWFIIRLPNRHREPKC